MLSRTFRPAMFGIGVALLVTPYAASEVKAQSAWQFHLEEATIGDVHRAIRAKQITAEQLLSLYFKRIEAYNGTCVKGDIDSVTGLMLGDLTPIENAGQINAYVTLNVRGQRSKTDRVDNDPKMSDALEVASLGLIMYADGAWGHTGTVENTHAMGLRRPDGVTWSVLVNGEVPWESENLRQIFDEAIASSGVIL